MRGNRPKSLGAASAVLLAVVSSTGCVDEADPRGGFLDRWLEGHAPLLSARSRSAVVEALLDSETETGTDAFLLLAVIEEESRYDPSGRSRKGARGLMQVRPSTARAVAARAGIAWSGEQDLDDPVTNVRIGAAYLAELKEQFVGWKTTLAAYHEGPTRIRRIERRGGKISTRYASRVLRRYRRILEAYGEGATSSGFPDQSAASGIAASRRGAGRTRWCRRSSLHVRRVRSRPVVAG